MTTAATSPIRVLCADDQPPVTEAMIAVLRAPRFEVAAVHSIAELDGALARFGPRVLLLDIDMPGGEAPLAWLERSAERWPQTRTVMHSGFVSTELLDRALSAGAWGYLAKGDDPLAVAGLLERMLEQDRLAFSASIGLR